VKGGWDFGVSSELALVERKIAEAVRSPESILTDVAMHVIGAGGKRIRPTVTILSYRALGGQDAETVASISAAFELIHSATLIHDDINDGGTTRRGRITAYRKFGLHTSIVAGDFLFVKAFGLGGVFGGKIVELTAEACTKLAEGEILQARYKNDGRISFDQYLKIIEGKTAFPIAAGAKVGAYLAEAELDEIDALGEYGMNLGIAFQIVDDVLDVIGDAATLGKATGSDIREGNLTLPSILAMDRSKEAEVAILAAIKQSPPPEPEVRRCLELIRSTGAIDQSMEIAREYTHGALEYLEGINDGPYRHGMTELAQRILDRAS